MADNSQNAYLRTMISTASPAELRLMLFDGAIRFGEQARAGLQENNYEKLHNGITKCQDIVMELINSLRPEHDPQLCDKLSALYVFIYTRLMNAGSRREIAPLDEALELIRYERETWAMVLKKLKQDGRQPRHGNDTAGSPISNGAAKSQSPADSPVGSRVSIQG